MATDPGDLAIVNAVVTLSQQFGLAVVAEGVESELTLELLQDIGCEIGQGFLFSRPLPYERLEAWFGAQAEPERDRPRRGAAGCASCPELGDRTIAGGSDFTPGAVPCTLTPARLTGRSRRPP